jgi:hypothetical protein
VFNQFDQNGFACISLTQQIDIWWTTRKKVKFFLPTAEVSKFQKYSPHGLNC